MRAAGSLFGKSDCCIDCNISEGNANLDKIKTPLENIRIYVRKKNK